MSDGILDKIIECRKILYEQAVPREGRYFNIAGFKLCVGTRWKCGKGHEWVSAHCDCGWFMVPTTCPECGETATAHRGEWRTLGELADGVEVTG